jgi:hypothetical protein
VVIRINTLSTNLTANIFKFAGDVESLPGEEETGEGER